MADDELTTIQRLQHRDLPAAEARALAWLRGLLGTGVDAVTLTPKPTSLNSFNGFARIDGNEIFFKSHTEPGSTIKEYYNSEILHEAGYNVVLPLRTEHREGQQIAFYPVITEPVMFDLMRTVERDGGDPEPLLAAEERECARLLIIYERTAEKTDTADAPVHQLFWHRLTGGRYASFYPDLGEILDARWTVNGVEQPRTLGQLVDEAVEVLDPAHTPKTTAIGHGDAHFGNVFLQHGREFLYFDPAFAGRHCPTLDIVKPLFHNVFAQWMYFPGEKAAEIPVDVRRVKGRIEVTYRDAFPPVRKALLDVKLRHLVEPLGAHKERAFHLALMCCPLLTMNLTDTARFPEPVRWLGLALSLQMGNWDTDQDFAFG